MPEVLKQLETLTIPHPGAYDVVVLQGGPVAWFEDNGTPAAVKGSATLESLGRIHLLATGNALVSVADHVRPVSARKAASGAAAQPEPARKAAGKHAAQADQAPSAGAARKAKPSSAKQRPAGKTNKPTRSQAEAKATPKDPASRRSQPKAKGK